MGFNLLLIAVVLGVLLFVPAGTLNWPAAWIFLLGFLAFLLLYGMWALRNDPAQLQERSRAGANVKRWDKIILSLYSIVLVMLFPVCAMDVVRFRWSAMPAGWNALGWVAIGSAGGIILWVMRTNTFASRQARIQSDRGQTVVSNGPYKFVRHPMYLGIILFFLGIPFGLGSWWGLIPSCVIAALFATRTALEDRMLQTELPGYAEYAARVRVRILPGIW
jgi:protein-S-isoprenylcysteine O-methyltransferase Ste14